MAQRLKRLPAMRKTWVLSLGLEDLLEKEMATHSSILAWKIPWVEEPGGPQSTGHKESDTTERLHNGNPLQYSCLENPMDGGAWRAAVHGVTKSWTQLSN